MKNTLFATLVFGIFLISLVSAATINVPTDFSTIQAAVDAATPGDIVDVAAGTYPENVEVVKSVNLIGADRDTTIIDGSGTGIVVTITASDVKLSGFTIKNSGTDINANGGVVIVNAGASETTGVTIEKNIITSNAIGVAVMGASSSTIFDNIISNSLRYGIVLEVSPYTGRYSTSNIISGNTMTANARDGIYAGQDCDDNAITGNIISGASGTTEGSTFEGNGIYLWKSSGNTIINNNIFGNIAYGIEMQGSSNNTIVANSLTGNQDGFHIRNTAIPGYSIRNNNISRNLVYDNIRVNLYANPNFVFNIEDNWWGTNDNSTIVSKLASWDASGNVVPGTIVYLDYDPWLCSANPLDSDGDGYNICADCDDSNAQIHPGASEITGDGIDQNCNGLERCYIDFDDDGFRITDTIISSDSDCSDSSEALTSEPTGDCDDTNALINPSVNEVCNDGIDNNCNSLKDCDESYCVSINASGPSGKECCSVATDCFGADSSCKRCGTNNECSPRPTTFLCNSNYSCSNSIFGDNSFGVADFLSPKQGYCDGAGSCDSTISAGSICNLAKNSSQEGTGLNMCWDGVSWCRDSCADGVDNDNDSCLDNTDVDCGAVEFSCDGLDDNCNGLTDEDVKLTFYLDADNDGHGLSSSTILACSAPAGYSSLSDDCDDADSARYPGNAEVCDGKDNDCDGDVDEVFTSESCNYVCTASGFNWTNNGGNLNCCGNHAGEARPFESFEISCDGFDNNCDGTVDNAPQPFIEVLSPEESSWHNSAFDVFILDSDLNVDTTNCEYRVKSLTNSGWVYTTNWIDRECNSTINLTVREYANCISEGYETCRVYLRNSNSAGCDSNLSDVYFSVDVSAPTLKDPLPQDGEFTNNSLAEVSLFYGDRNLVGANLSSIKMILDGVDVSPNLNITSSRIIYRTAVAYAEGNHNVYVEVEDLIGNKANFSWDFTVDSILPAFDIISPESKLYYVKNIPVIVQVNDSVAKSILMSRDGRKFTTLCTDCNNISKIYPFSYFPRNQNDNRTLIIRVIDYAGNLKESSINFDVDIKKPRIFSTLPRRGATTNGGDFYIKISEENLDSVSLNIVSDITPEESFPVANCTIGDRYIECWKSIDLSDYNGDEISYYFNVSDGYNMVSSKLTRVKVDTTNPELDINLPIANSTSTRAVIFNLTMGEKVLLEYKDNSVLNSKWKTVCTNCDEYGLNRKRTISFANGAHNIEIRATDAAGNSDLATANFKVI